MKSTGKRVVMAVEPVTERGRVTRQRIVAAAGKVVAEKVFGIMALHDRHRAQARDWVSALGIVVGLGACLALARPSNGHHDPSASVWVLAGVCTFSLAGLLAGLAYLPGRSSDRPSAGRKAALLGVPAATAFGFVAAVVKELSGHLSQGLAGVFGNWSPYVLLLSGAVAIFLASNAFQAGSLAASQPGLTIVDPLVASTLGVVLLGEQLDPGPAALGGGILALTLVLVSVIMLSRSPLVHTEDHPARLSPVPSQRIDRSGAWILVLTIRCRHQGCLSRPVVRNRRQRRRPGDDRPVGARTVDHPGSVAGTSTTPVYYVACMCRRLAYCSWPLAFLVNPSLAGNGLASSFEGPSQPFRWLFILLDCVAGLCIAIVVFANCAPVTGS